MGLNPAPDLAAVAAACALPGAFVAGEPYGTGHINDTYRITVAGPAGPVRFILRRINRLVFPAPELVVANTIQVCRHLEAVYRRRGEADGDRRRQVPVPTRDGAWRHVDPAGDWWCAFRFQEGTVGRDEIGSEQEAWQAARAFGRFLRDTADLPPERMAETIPGFHDGRRRLADLEAAATADACGRVPGAAAELAFVRDHRPIVADVVRLLAAGILPRRVTHNDTKCNNVLLDAATGEGLCVIDLDTVMPGSALFDFGDMVRSFVSAAPEDDPDPERTRLRPGIFAALAAGWLEPLAGVLTAAEREHLLLGARLIILLIGTRFLTDHLRGDVYFKTHRPGHNLDRCRNQFHLLADLEARQADLERILRAIP